MSDGAMTAFLQVPLVLSRAAEAVGTFCRPPPVTRLLMYLLLGGGTPPRLACVWVLAGQDCMHVLSVFRVRVNWAGLWCRSACPIEHARRLAHAGV